MLYADYLRQTGTQLYYGADTYWRIYQGCLVPASPIPTFVNIDTETSKRLLAESGAYMIRWSNDPSDKEMPWWWIVCDHYDIKRLDRETQKRIERGYKNCSVCLISAEWLAEFGYDCYKKAFQRYSNANPMSITEFRTNIQSKIDYQLLFEYWGAFFENNLIGYIECIIEDGKGVATNVSKYDPYYLKGDMKCYPSYILTDTILSEYIIKRNLLVSGGNRAISHDTNIQDFRLKFGYGRQYCRLNVMYQPCLKLAISCLYPFRSLISDKGIMHKAKAILFQEELGRECQKMIIS